MVRDLHCAVDFGKVSIRHHLRRLVADTNLETGWAPVDELNGPLCLECSDSLVDIVRDHITTVQQASCHIFAVARITFDHLVVGLEAGH